MQKQYSWQYDEFQQVGKDYAKQEEVNAYDPSHAQFRDIEAESLKAFEKFALTKDDILLDFGCGTGTFSVLAAQRCKHVYAVDVSEAMLHYAREKSVSAGVTNLSFSNAGFLTYKHNGESPTVITSTFSFHHLPDFWKGVALQNIHSLLAPGGRFYLCDVIMGVDQPLQKIDQFIQRQDALGGDFLREDAEGHFRDEFSTYDWVMEGLLERTGFSITSKETNDDVVMTYLATKRL